MAGCGDDSSDETVKETKAKATQMPTKAAEETKAKAEEKDKIVQIHDWCQCDKKFYIAKAQAVFF